MATAQMSNNGIVVMNRADLSDDGFLGCRLQILQPAKGYRAGIDAVMLAASVDAKPGERVLDLGAGVGTASLCLAHRLAGIAVTGLEVQADLVVLAQENARRNGLAARATFVEGSVAEKAASLATKEIAYGSFDHVMTNPPFYDEEKVWPSPDAGKAKAHAFDEVNLKTWVEVACAMAKPKGTVTFVHRADALPDLLLHVGKRLGDLKVLPLWLRQGEDAKRILLRGTKGSRAPFTMMSGFTLHRREGGFTAEADAILKEGGALPFKIA
ncbi:MAG: methyltransferase [Alphaproteobacteria bacterium]|nr:methyltransferase [Alphaproteobacteria bacterium]MBO6627966.1 methyltransferase [Alphaproteobacteria bacterium]MDF1625536.1 methyltransferase [Parvibaculaceae bacterium]